MKKKYDVSLTIEVVEEIKKKNINLSGLIDDLLKEYLRKDTKDLKEISKYPKWFGEIDKRMYEFIKKNPARSIEIYNASYGTFEFELLLEYINDPNKET